MCILNLQKEIKNDAQVIAEVEFVLQMDNGG